MDSVYSFQGSLDLHRHALGWDILRAPLNVLLVLPTALLMATAAVRRKCLMKPNKGVLTAVFLFAVEIKPFSGHLTM